MAAALLTSGVYLSADFNASNDSCSSNLTDRMNSGWVNEYFGQCITDLTQWFAFVIGMSSILFWMVAQVPQLVKNCRTGKADQVLSFWFLLQWVIGDTTNLLGSILTNQLFTQLATAVYFVLVDCVTMAQFVYYLIRNQGVKGLLSCFKIQKPSMLAIVLPGMMFTVLLASQGPSLWGGRDTYHIQARRGRTLMQDRPDTLVVDVTDPRDVAGYVLGCISAVFYVMSRVPQIVKNFRRCSVEGLSPVMFVLAILGNVTYGLGIFLYSVEPVFLLQKLPWLVGSVGTLFFDFTIISQFIVSRLSRCCRGNTEDSERTPLLRSKDDDVRVYSSRETIKLSHPHWRSALLCVYCGSSCPCNRVHV